MHESIDIAPKELWHIDIPYLGGMSITNTLFTAFLASGILILAAIIIRVFFLKKFRDQPRGLQNILELMVDGMSSFTYHRIGEKAGRAIAPYMFTLACLIGCNGLLELFSMGVLRTAPSDLNQTVAFALITFVLIRVVAYRQVGVIGRIKHYLSPQPLVAPIKLFTDLAVPISLSCRMYGNLLGGWVVMELLYSAWFLRFGIPVVGAAFFSLFHTGIQAYVFIMLSLAFMEEAIE